MENQAQQFTFVTGQIGNVTLCHENLINSSEFVEAESFVTCSRTMPLTRAQAKANLDTGDAATTPVKEYSLRSRENSLSARKTPRRTARQAQRTPVKQNSSGEKENLVPSPKRTTRSRSRGRQTYFNMDQDPEIDSDEDKPPVLSPQATMTAPKHVEDTPRTQAMMSGFGEMGLASGKKTPTRGLGKPSNAKPPTPNLDSELKKLKLSPSDKKKSGGAKRSLFGADKKEEETSGVSPSKKRKTGALKPNTLPWVRSQLCAAVVPDRLPCRNAEYRHIETFFWEAVKSNGRSQSMYISGVPGTGKTATVLQVAKMGKQNPKFPRFDFVRVNAMELADPKHFFVAVHNQLFPELAKRRIAVGTARRKLNDMFLYKDPKRAPIVILVDELDLLCTKRQDIIYDLFNWASVAESRVNVIAIANTLDLPERALSLRITSRIGFNRLTFQPYEFEQIGSILQDRLNGATCISKDAVNFASRKVAAISGDLRKALDVVKRAAELAIEGESGKLELKHVTPQRGLGPFPYTFAKGRNGSFMTGKTKTR